MKSWILGCLYDCLFACQVLIWDELEIKGMEIIHTPCHHWGARYVHDMMQRMLNGVPVFLDSTELTDLNAIFENGVLKCETLAVFLTDSVFTRPWCLLEIFEAHRHGIPIILLAAHGTSSSTSDVLGKAEQFIERLEDNLNPEILKQIEP